MKHNLLKYLILVTVFTSSSFFMVSAQYLTVFDQLKSVNSLWKNQADINPALLHLPAGNLTEQQLIQFHLQQTEMLLRKRTPAGLTVLQKKNREHNLDVLHNYWQNGVFPVNDLHEGRQPYFIDRFNTYCAVGYLMQQTGADDMAKQISHTQNFNYLADITHPHLMEWVNNSGLELDELALIQPAYLGDWISAITELHYNNTGTDVDEYIEVHQASYSLNASRGQFVSILFYDDQNVLYRTMQVAQMQQFLEQGNTFYYYQFPANENLADSGKIVLINNIAETLFSFYYNASGITQEEHDPFNNNTIFRTRQYNTIEDDNTPAGSTLGFCGRFNFTSGPDMWQPSINPATAGNINPCLILAVSLTDLTYAISGKAVLLKWQTTTEYDLDSFILERSSDGINFSMIGKVIAAGNSSVPLQYSLLDNSPSYLNHYRLKLVNRDGSFTYSKILFVKFAAANPVTILINPAGSTLKLNINSTGTSPGNMIIYDFSGRKIKEVIARRGNQEIDITSFTAGKYMIQLQTADGKVYNQPFIKQ